MKLNTRTEWIPNGFVAASEKPLFGDTAPHIHEFFEIEYVIRGSGICEIDGRPYPMASGTLFFLSPTNTHAIRSADAEIVNVMFRFPSAEESLPLPSASASPCFLLKEEDSILVYSLLKELVTVYSDDLRYARLLLSTLLRKLSRLSNAEAQESLPYVRSAILYVTECFHEGVTLKSTADRLGLSPTYFSSLFRNETGMSFKSYLDGVRFAHAKSLLAFTKLPVLEIAIRAGFGDYANFSRRFRSRLGITPSEYRRNAAQ